MTLQSCEVVSFAYMASPVQRAVGRHGAQTIPPFKILCAEAIAYLQHNNVRILSESGQRYSCECWQVEVCHAVSARLHVDLQSALHCIDGPLRTIPFLAGKLRALTVDILCGASNCTPCLLEGAACAGVSARSGRAPAKRQTRQVLQNTI